MARGAEQTPPGKSTYLAFRTSAAAVRVSPSAGASTASTSMPLMCALAALNSSVPPGGAGGAVVRSWMRSEEHTSELQSLMRISYAVFCLKTKNNQLNNRLKAYTRHRNRDR